MSNEPQKNRSSFRILRDTAGAFLCGLIFSCAGLGSISCPVPAAAAMCAGPVSSVAVLIGALVTCCISGTLFDNIQLIISLMLAACVRIILHEYHSQLFVSVMSALCVLASGIVCSAAGGSGAEGILVSIMSAILTGTTAYFLNMVLHSIGNRNKIHISSSAGCAAAVVYFVLIAALCSFEFSLLNPGCIIGSAVTLIAARRYRCSGGVICGALTACGAVLSAQELGMSLSFLPVTGLIAGYMAENGSFAVSGVFFLFNALAQLTVMSSSSSYSAIGNLMTGCALYLLLQTVCIDKWIITEDPAAQKVMDNMKLRMNFLAASICSVRTDTERIARVLKRSAYEETLEGQKTPVCAVCGIREKCGIMNGSAEMAHSEKCRVIMHEQNRMRLYRERTARKTESRNILFQQLIASEKIISSLADNYSVRYCSELTEAIERRLDRCGYCCDSVAAYYDERERITVEIYSSETGFEDDMPEIQRIISEMFRIQLQELAKVRSGKTVRFSLGQTAAYYLKYHCSKRCAENGEVSGDTASVFYNGTGTACAIISDGMGTGKSAAVESKMTSEMFRKLIGSGVDRESAVRIINGLMFTKSEQESFATLDAAFFDLDSCEVTLMKSGAASTIIRQGDRVLRICAPTFPIGSEAAPDIFVKNLELSRGDVVVMLSDGVPEGQYPFIKELLMSSEDVKSISEEICRKAQIFSGGRSRDDVSVMVIEICRKSDTGNFF